MILYTKKEELAKKGRGFLTYLKNDIKFRVIKDLSVSDDDNEYVTVEIENRNSKNLLNIWCYRLPSGAIKGLHSSLENLNISIRA